VSLAVRPVDGYARMTECGPRAETGRVDDLAHGWEVRAPPPQIAGRAGYRTPLNTLTRPSFTAKDRSLAVMSTHRG